MPSATNRFRILSPTDIATLCALIFLAAGFYASVGHGGASGYLAAMALYGLSPATMKPTALALNILVSTMATFRWWRAGSLNWKAVLPLVVASVPAAFIGGWIHLPNLWYRALIGVALLVAAAKLIWESRAIAADGGKESAVPWLGGGAAGAGVGLLSGLTGTGGGIFLSPILLFANWATARQAAGIVAPFILLNSIAGLAGNVAAVRSLPAELPYFLVAALLGGLAGLQFGVRMASNVMLQRLLGIILIVAAGKFLFT